MTEDEARRLADLECLIKLFGVNIIIHEDYEMPRIFADPGPCVFRGRAKWMVEFKLDAKCRQLCAVQTFDQVERLVNLKLGHHEQ